MLTKLAVLIVSIVALVLSGCGSSPPMVNSKDDIQRLPASQQSIFARGLADGDIPSLARLQALRYLSFGGGNGVMPAKITNDGLAKLAKLDLPNLVLLDLGWCDDITDAGLAPVGRMQTITQLLLMSCPKITDAGLLELIVSENLINLDLRANPNITDERIQQLATKANWTTIELGGCPKITAEGVAKLQAALPKARVKKDDQEWEYHAPESRNPPWRNQK